MNLDFLYLNKVSYLDEHSFDRRRHLKFSGSTNPAETERSQCLSLPVQLANSTSSLRDSDVLLINLLFTHCFSLPSYLSSLVRFALGVSDKLQLVQVLSSSLSNILRRLDLEQSVENRRKNVVRILRSERLG